MDTVVGRRRINVKAFLADVREGLDQAILMEKYGLSENGLQSLLKKLRERGIISPEDLTDHGEGAPSPRLILTHRVTGDIIFSEKAESVKELVEAAVLAGAPLTDALFSGKMLCGANLAGADLRRADLSHADLSGANLTRASLTGADLTGADLSLAQLEAADLLNANLTGANLDRARLSRANLANADLTGAVLTDADLSYCNIVGGNITAADMRGAALEGASMHGVVRDKVADDRAEFRERLNRFLLRPAAGLLLQLFFFAVQVCAALLTGPFVVCWFVGIAAVNVYLMVTRSWWWVFGLAVQLIFLGILFLSARRMIFGF